MPTHLPSDVPFQRLRTHLIQEQFEHASDHQQPGKWVLDLYGDRLTIDTSSPKKGTKNFAAWVENLKTKIEQMHSRPNNAVVYMDGAYHHKDHKAAFAFTVFHNTTWHDNYSWCPAASSFEAELHTIEAALEHVTTRSHHDHVTLVIDNKAAANSLFNFEVQSNVGRQNQHAPELVVRQQSSTLSLYPLRPKPSRRRWE